MATQKETVRRVLESGRTLTSAEASTRYGVANLRARITELRQDGLRIQSVPFTRRDGVRAVKYALEGQTVTTSTARTATRATKTAATKRSTVAVATPATATPRSTRSRSVAR